MKKKITVLLTLLLVLVMETTTVYATEINNPSVLSGEVVTATLDEDYYALIRLTSVDGIITVSSDVNIALIRNGDVEMTGLDDEGLVAVRLKMQELAEEADLRGYNMDGMAFNINSSETELTLEFIDARVLATDKENGLVKVYHQLSDGTWEEPEFDSYDGRIVVYFKNGFSPVIIAKYSIKESASGDGYTVAPSDTSTISGSVSPKTADSYSYLIVILLAIVGCIVLCITRRYAKK